MKDKAKLIYCITWSVIIILISAFCAIAVMGGDSEDLLLAFLFGIIPGIMQLLAILHIFFKREKGKSFFKFFLINFLIVFIGTFVVEAIIIFIYFGISKPQPKLLLFALGFACMTLVFNTCQGILGKLINELVKAIKKASRVSKEVKKMN